MTAASLSETSAERSRLLQTVLGLLDRAVGLLPESGRTACAAPCRGDLEGERRIERGYEALRKSTLERRDAGRPRQDGGVRAVARQGQGKTSASAASAPGEVAALLATIDLRPRRRSRHADRQGSGRNARRPSAAIAARRTIVFQSSRTPGPLEQVKAMSGPPVHTIAPAGQAGRRSPASSVAKVEPAAGAGPSHALVRSAWELADNGVPLRVESVSSNSVDVAQRASSAAAGALMLYSARGADQPPPWSRRRAGDSTPRVRGPALRSGQPPAPACFARRTCRDRSHLVELCAPRPGAAADTFVLVPTSAAAGQLRRTLDERLAERRSSLPHIGTRARSVRANCCRACRIRRDATPSSSARRMLAAAARDAEEGGAPPPFHVRPALVAEMLGALRSHPPAGPHGG